MLLPSLLERVLANRALCPPDQAVCEQSGCQGDGEQAAVERSRRSGDLGFGLCSPMVFSLPAEGLACDSSRLFRVLS